MRRVKAPVVYIGRERFEAGAVLPDSVSEPMAKKLEDQGAVESDAPKRSRKAKDEESE